MGLSVLKQTTGSFGGDLLLGIALVGGLGGALALAHVSRGWRSLFLEEGGRVVELSAVPHSIMAEVEAVA